MRPVSRVLNVRPLNKTKGCLIANFATVPKIVLQWDEMIRTAGSLKLGKVQASVLVRSLLKSERPSGLTQAIIEVGRINKTLYLLNYIDDEDYRRRILTQLNRGESRHAVARAICHGQKGEIRKRYTDGQEKINWAHWGWSLTPSCYGTLFICRQPGSSPGAG